MLVAAPLRVLPAVVATVRGSHIPEAISFSIIAGVDPSVGLFASFTMAVVISIAGGRPAMISAATGVVAPLAREHGLGYLVVTGFFGGMGGCAMIGQAMINVKNGARTRLSTFLGACS